MEIFFQPIFFLRVTVPPLATSWWVSDRKREKVWIKKEGNRIVWERTKLSKKDKFCLTSALVRALRHPTITFGVWGSFSGVWCVHIWPIHAIETHRHLSLSPDLVGYHDTNTRLVGYFNSSSSGKGTEEEEAGGSRNSKRWNCVRVAGAAQVLGERGGGRDGTRTREGEAVPVVVVVVISE